MILFLQTLIWLVVIQIFVTIHFWTIERNKKTPRHWISFGVAGLLAGILSLLYTHRIEGYVNLAYLAMLYWILFPLQLNLFRNKPLLYEGVDSDAGEDSRLDTFTMMFTPHVTLGIKIGVAMGCLIFLLWR